MKNKFIIVLILLSILSYFPSTMTKYYRTYAETSYYGRAVNKATYLYSTPNILNDLQNVIFEIPTTYFVQILQNENENFFKAKYIDVIGYVKKTDIKCIRETPNVPYATNIGFRVFVPSGANLRSSPNKSVGVSNLIISLPHLETNLNYYGITPGEEAIIYKGTTWYYCKYVIANEVYYGYVYECLCDLLTPFPDNKEIFEYISPEFNEETIQTGTTISPLSFNSPVQILIIIAISLPCLLIIYFLFKPSTIAMQETSPSQNKNKRKKKKNKIKKLRNSDYYELDSDYFDN